MEKLVLLLAALTLVVLGARGTYKAVWNQFFPNEQIVTTPVSTVGNTGTGTGTGTTAPSGSAGNPKGSSPVTKTPNVTQTGGSNVGQPVTIVKGGGASYPVSTVNATGGGAPIRVPYNNNAPDWWPSWLPYP